MVYWQFVPKRRPMVNTMEAFFLLYAFVYYARYIAGLFLRSKSLSLHRWILLVLDFRSSMVTSKWARRCLLDSERGLHFGFWMFHRYSTSLWIHKKSTFWSSMASIMGFCSPRCITGRRMASQIGDRFVSSLCLKNPKIPPYSNQICLIGRNILASRCFGIVLRVIIRQIWSNIA